MEIELLKKQLAEACKALGWTLDDKFERNARDGDDELFFLTIDDIDYWIGADATPGNEGKFAFGVMVQHSGSRIEPPSEDDKCLSKVSLEKPEHFLSQILDSHWNWRKSIAMECAAYAGQPENPDEEQM